jgi:predicted permease
VLEALKFYREEIAVYVHQSLRHLASEPLVTGAIILSLVLGIGFNTVVFSFLDRFFLHPLPSVPAADRVAAIYSRSDEGPGILPVSYLDFRDYQERARSFLHFAARRMVSLGWAGVGAAEQVPGELVSAEYFATLGLHPAAGRTFLAEECRVPGDHRVAVISHALWRSRFDGDPRAVGRSVDLNGSRFQIIGVAPEGFHGVDSFSATQVWLPLSASSVTTGDAEIFTQRSRRSLLLLGRLQPGVSLERAAAEMRGLASRLAIENPSSNRGQTVELLRLPEAVLYPSIRKTLLRAGTLLALMAAILLLATCVNVANLLLARAISRHREWAVRLALGARRGHLARQLLVESALLIFLGGAGSLIFSLWLWKLLCRYRPPYIDAGSLTAALDAPLLVSTLIITVATALLFGFAPLRYAMSSDAASLLKEAPQAPRTHAGRVPAERLAITVQAAFCTAALACGGLFLSSLQTGRAVPPGFAVNNIAMFSFDLRSRGYGETEGRAIQELIRIRLTALQGVENVSLAENRLLGGFRLFREIRPWGAAAEDGKQGYMAGSSIVDADYFRTTGISILRGRAFRANDRGGNSAVTIINETLARYLGGDPLGRRLELDDESQPVEIVGIARDTKYQTLSEDPRPFLYLPLAQRYSAAVTAHLRISPGAVGGVLPSARRTFHEIEPGLPLLAVQTVADSIDRSLWASRMNAVVLGVLGLLTLSLTATGVYAVTANAVARQKSEIDIRLALGARRAEVVLLILRRGARPLAVGLGVGLLSAAGLHAWASGLLYQLPGSGLPILAGASGLLLLVGFVALLVPASRAVRATPLRSLRGR